MTREAAIEGVERFVDRTVDATRREFRVGHALRGTRLGPGGAVVDRLGREADALERRVVEPELDTYRRRSIEQFEVVFAYAESDDRLHGRGHPRDATRRATGRPRDERRGRDAVREWKHFVAVASAVDVGSASDVSSSSDGVNGVAVGS